MERLLVVDGSNLLFQMFYGMPARIPGPGGRPIQGTLGFVGGLLRIIRMVKPSHVAVVFDGECSNPRRDLDGDYKANRLDYSQLPEEETPFSQLPDVFRALDWLGVCYRETWDCEADDWLAAIARQWGQQLEVVISSQDSDLFQLITDRVKILRYRGENTVLWDREKLLEKLDILPEQYADFKALTGDHSDNIRGAEKVGPKTAAALMGQFGSLEALLDGIQEIRKPSVRTSVEQCRGRLLTNLALIRLTGEGSLPFTLEELRWQDLGFTTTEVLKAIDLR